MAEDDAGAAGQHAVGARSPPSINPERGAWSGGFGIVGPGALSSAKNVVPTKASELVFTLSSGEGKQAASSRERRLSERQGNQVWGVGYDGPQLRGGVEMLPAHAAALDGRVWWLERCGASASCRRGSWACATRGATRHSTTARAPAARRRAGCSCASAWTRGPITGRGGCRSSSPRARGTRRSPSCSAAAARGATSCATRTTAWASSRRRPTSCPSPACTRRRACGARCRCRRAATPSRRCPCRGRSSRAPGPRSRVIGVVQGCLMATDFDLKESARPRPTPLRPCSPEAPMRRRGRGSAASWSTSRRRRSRRMRLDTGWPCSGSASREAARARPCSGASTPCGALSASRCRRRRRSNGTNLHTVHF
ncbi:unnamed protein product [Prorocentrum cordatum]|uniref:Uncharacterized protein n=1 Tax=Prorocentrum cordatum TaxID=2364126 RepID=A0ABN9VHS8_9DINO|nr:unnamed protein product [Polarella glacialis]